MVSMQNLFTQIDAALEGIAHGWTSPYKAHIMAACVISLRPKVSVEIGVYAGKGLITLGLAHKFIGSGVAIGIDPYSAAASVEGQVKPEDKAFWEKLDHEAIFKMATGNISRFSVSNTAKIARSRSDKFDPPDGIGFLRIDANHGESVLSDVERYVPAVVRGGFIFMDDKQWAGGSVERAFEMLKKRGVRLLYEYKEPEGEVWGVFQKV